MATILMWIGIVVFALVVALVTGTTLYSWLEAPSEEPIRLNHDDPGFQDVEQAERIFFERYGLGDYRAHDVELREPPLRVRVIEAGNGPPLVVIPGGQGEVGEFVDLIAELPDFRVLAINRPGGGGSDGIDHRAVGMRELALATLTAVYDRFDLDHAPIVGNSMGGLWAFWYALERPERVPALVQVGTTAIVEGTTAVFPLRLMAIPGLNRLLIRAVRPDSPDAIREDARRLGHPEKIGEKWPAERLRYMYRVRQLPTYDIGMPSLAEHLLSPTSSTGLKPDAVLSLETLAQVEQPTLLIWGSSDPYGTLDAARDLEAALPNGELHQVGVGHLPWWDEPETTARLIREFLAGR